MQTSFRITWGLDDYSVVIRLLYVKQVFGGGVQENPLFPVARESDRLQPRLFILCHMENHAEFQVW